MTRVCFVAAGPESWGSSRMRAYWPARKMASAAVVQFGQPLPAADVYVWQKLVDLGAVRARAQARHIWDVCDPAWWWQPAECREIAEQVGGAVASSASLAVDYVDWSGRPCDVIPDRLDLAHFPRVKAHAAARPVRLIWYGVAVNRLALLAALANLERLAANEHDVALTVCDDRPGDVLNWTDAFPIYHVRWSLEQEVETLLAHDIALLPPYPGPWGRVKSNNKRLTAWAAGLPATTGECYADLARLVADPAERRARGEAGRWEVETSWTVERSAAEWEALCAS